MGARGPGARAIRRPETANAPKPVTPKRRKPYWQRRGLTMAQRVVAFIQSLRITSGAHAGRRFMLRPWQKAIVAEWFRVDAKGKRIVTTAVLSMGRKNGKSTLVAAIALNFLIGPCRERRGQIVVGAADRDQSGLIYDEMCAMLEADEALRDQVTIRRHEKVIEALDDGSKFRALSSDAKKSFGMSPSVVILDELGIWGEGLGLRLYTALMTATGARAEPLKIIISTQASHDLSKMSELIDYGEQVNAGIIADPSFCCRVYSVPDELDMWDEQHWKLANPALGDFRSITELREVAARARRIKSEQSAFENLMLNRRVAAEERWIGKNDWLACQGTIGPDLLTGECFGGLDLGSVSDLTSFTLVWPETGALLSWSWCPADRIAERVERDRAPYDVWARESLIEPTPGKATNKRRVALRLAEINALYAPTVIGFDRWQMAELQRILAEEGIELPLQEWGQGYQSMSPAAKAFEERVLNGRLRHDNALLTWALSNVRLERDAAGNIKPSKERSREKIDPVTAAVIAVGVAAAQPAPRVYDFSQMAVLTA